MKLKALLLDLDGTLVDTAPDMVGALNRLLKNHNKPVVDYHRATKFVSKGAIALIQLGFGNDLNDKELAQLRHQFLNSYEMNLSAQSQIYQGMLEVLSLCEDNNLHWGVVTNKPYYLAEPLLKQFNLLDRASILLGGDSLPLSKPHPMPLLHCCLTLDLAASECLYVGDDERDVLAGNAAGMDTAVAQWGYLSDSADFENWQANYLIGQPMGLKTLIEEKLV